MFKTVSVPGRGKRNVETASSWSELIRQSQFAFSEERLPEPALAVALCGNPSKTRIAGATVLF